MTTELSTREWHARAAALRYATGHFIDGEHVDSLARGRFTAVNPATLQPLAEVSAGTGADIDRAVASGRRAFASGVWRRMAPRDRLGVLSRFAGLIQANAERFALMDTLTMGKPNPRTPISA
jgi:gamma-glutamyl-gamma-aminobutyraldehyde dehydrogenase